MKKTPSFAAWVRSQAKRTDSVGDFARAVLADPDLEGVDFQFETIVDRIEYQGAGKEQLKAARDAMAEYAKIA